MVSFEKVFVAALNVSVTEDMIKKSLEEDVWYDTEVFGRKLLVKWYIKSPSCIKKTTFLGKIKKLLGKPADCSSLFDKPFFDVVCTKKRDDEDYEKLPDFMTERVESFLKSTKIRLPEEWIPKKEEIDYSYEALDMNKLFTEV